MQVQSGCPRDSQLLPHAQPSGSTSCSHLQPRHYQKTTLLLSASNTRHRSSRSQLQSHPAHFSAGLDPSLIARVRPSVNNALEARTSGPSLPSALSPSPRAFLSRVQLRL